MRQGLILNQAAERKLNGVIVATIFADQKGVTISPVITEMMDAIGVALLGQIKRESQLDAAEMNAQLIKLSNQLHKEQREARQS